VKTYIEIFNEQRTKLKEVQFVDCGTRLDSNAGHTIAVTSVAITIMLNAIDITFIAVVVVVVLIITYYDWRALVSNRDSS
jgi:hypothetical protein